MKVIVGSNCDDKHTQDYRIKGINPSVVDGNCGEVKRLPFMPHSKEES